MSRTMSRTSATSEADVTTTAAGPAADGPASDGDQPPTPRRALLRGLPWLVWRRHRALLRTAALLTVAGCALFAYQRLGLMDFLHANGSSPAGGERTVGDFQSKFGTMFSNHSWALQSLPVLAGIFLGAPLIAGEQEHGTVKLVTTQSVSRTRWIAATLGLPLAAATACTTLLSAAFTWLWSPAHNLAMGGDWLQGGPFEATGPIPVARTLFLTACGIALGMLIKRVVPAMAATFAFAVVVDVIWSEKVRNQLGTLRSVSYPYNGDGPDLPLGAVRIDDWVSTADGKLYGFSTCVHDHAPDACRAKLGIVNRVTQYFDYGQMPQMQWLGTGILLALTAAVLAFIVWRAQRRPL